MSAGQDTMYQPPTPHGAQASPLPLPAPRLSQAPWGVDELGELAAQMHPHDSQRTSIWQNAGEEAIYRVAFTLRDKQYTFTCFPQGRAPALLHTLALQKCLNDGIWGTKKRNCLMWMIFGGLSYKRRGTRQK